MENVLFLQSEVKDPYAFYARMRSEHPVYYDSHHKIWAVYTHNHCEQVLQTSQAQVVAPQSNLNQHAGLNDIVTRLARLSSGEQHLQARAAAMHLMEKWRMPAVPDLFHVLIREPRLPATIDWIPAVATRLPALALLQGFDIPTPAALSVLPDVENLVKLMTPANDNAEIERIAESIGKVREVFNAHVAPKLTDTQDQFYFANFVGLLIQSYDATRGLLSNALLDFVHLPAHRPTTYHDAMSFVKESARLDPAVQNTRRYTTSDLRVGDHLIQKGEQVLIVLASANRDAAKFQDPDSFTPGRTGGTLTFGSGMHQCTAEHFSIHLTASLLHYLQTKCARFSVRESAVQFEPRINVRLPRQITLLMS